MKNGDAMFQKNSVIDLAGTSYNTSQISRLNFVVKKKVTNTT